MIRWNFKQAVREGAATVCPGPCKLIFDLLTLKVVSESRVTWATSVPILVFLGLSVLDLGPMYATDRRQTRLRLMPLPYGVGGIINHVSGELITRRPITEPLRLPILQLAPIFAKYVGSTSKRTTVGCRSGDGISDLMHCSIIMHTHADDLNILAEPHLPFHRWESSRPTYLFTANLLDVGRLLKPRL